MGIICNYDYQKESRKCVIGILQPLFCEKKEQSQPRQYMGLNDECPSRHLGFPQQSNTVERLTVFVLEGKFWPVRMPFNQETHHPFTCNDVEINSCFLICYFQFWNECVVKIYSPVYRNTQHEKGSYGIVHTAQDTDIMSKRSISDIHVEMILSVFKVSALVKHIKPKETHDTVYFCCNLLTPVVTQCQCTVKGWIYAGNLLLKNHGLIF